MLHSSLACGALQAQRDAGRLTVDRTRGTKFVNSTDTSAERLLDHRANNFASRIIHPAITMGKYYCDYCDM